MTAILRRQNDLRGLAVDAVFDGVFLSLEDLGERWILRFCFGDIGNLPLEMKSFTTFDGISLLKYVADVLVMCIMHSFTAVQRMHSCLPDSLIQMLDHEGKVLLAKGLIWLGQVCCLTSCLVICSWEGFRESLSLDLNSLLPLVKDGN